LLAALKKKWEAVNGVFQTITHQTVLDTKGKVRRKEQSEKELTQLEKDIARLSKKNGSFCIFSVCFCSNLAYSFFSPFCRLFQCTSSTNEIAHDDGLSLSLLGPCLHIQYLFIFVSVFNFHN
jgi:hypothetical protein